jgi:methyl-accepting chemotaxis protein
MLQRISHYLALLIVVSLLGLWVAGGNGIYQLLNARKAIKGLDEVTLPAIETVGKARTKLLELRLDVISHALAAHPEHKAVYLQEFNRDLVDIRKTLDAFQAGADDAQGKTLLATDREAIEGYVAAAQEIFPLSDANQTEQLKDLLRHKVMTKGDAAEAALNAHAAHVRKLADDRAAGNSREFARALWLTIGIEVVVTAVLLWAAMVTYRMVVGTAKMASRAVNRVATELDFSQPIPVNGRDELSDLLRAFNGLMARLREGFGQIRADADKVSGVSESLATAANQVMSSSRSQADAAASMAASVEQVTVSISHVSNQTGEASNLVSAAGVAASGGREAVIKVVSRVEDVASLMDEASTELAKLEASGKEIGTVVNVIKEVADQTNLLALNAAIEAARAGEQGRGFAVVADEVRKLAERTAASTTQIAGMVADIQARSGAVVERMTAAAESVRQGVTEGRDTRDAIQRIADASSSSSVLVSEIASALREQSSASNAIAAQVERVAQMSEENSRAAESSKDLSDELRTLSNTMQRVVSAYRL